MNICMIFFLEGRGRGWGEIRKGSACFLLSNLSGIDSVYSGLDTVVGDRKIGIMKAGLRCKYENEG